MEPVRAKPGLVRSHLSPLKETFIKPPAPRDMPVLGEPSRLAPVVSSSLLVNIAASVHEAMRVTPTVLSGIFML